ncbi:MAG TPA: hypothetical protein VHG89_03945 [Verrucomicrobiae bacterium]|nr:hypothetical protein [Verrucomicrobiae bacterium]
MKTPREILLERHQAAAPKLDAIRHEIVNSKFRRGNFAVTIWNELIFPSRRIWAGLAAIWVVIFIFNFSQRDQSELMAKKFPSPEMISSFQQQEKLLAELIGPNEPRVAEPPKTILPQPRSERRFEILTA